MRKLYSFSFYYILIGLPIWFNYLNIHNEKGFVLAVAYSVFSALVLLLPLVFVSFRWYVLLTSPLLVFLPFEVIHVLNYGGYSTRAALISSLNTNPEEFVGFVSSYGYIIYPVYVISLLVAYLAVKNHKFVRVAQKYKLMILAVFVALLSLFSLKVGADLYDRGGWKDVANGMREFYTRLILRSYPVVYAYNAYGYIEQKIQINKLKVLKKGFLFGAVKDSQSLQCAGDQGCNSNQVVVLVIGETSRSRNWSLYGYNRVTNPRLQSRKEIIVFQDAVTAATHTLQALQLVLTRATPHNLTPVYTEKSILSAFGEAGYKTAWISNQNISGGVDTPINIIANEADFVSFPFKDYRIRGDFDSVLVGKFEKFILENKGKPLFIVLHTMGSHELYRQRYPKDFEIFKPVVTGDDYNFASEGMREKLVNTYDNSILYTDYILDAFVDVLERNADESVLLYFSDHGENLLDDDGYSFGHGGVIPTLYVTDVPMLMWMSEEYRRLYPEKYSNAVGNALSPVSNLDVFDTLLGISGIEIPGYFRSRSLVSSIDPVKRYILNTNYKPILYDSLRNASAGGGVLRNDSMNGSGAQLRAVQD
jgi:glucan phosphoethanolaminetransferase (alkaline phosphatase superfamily)